jgi:cytochrome c oxidase subunit 2
MDYIENPVGKPPRDIGEFVWKTKCASCHSVDGSPNSGPTWKNAFGRVVEFSDGTSGPADENYIRESILYPAKKLVKGYGPNMPLISLRESQIEGVIAYMKTLSEAGAKTAEPAAEQK